MIDILSFLFGLGCIVTISYVFCNAIENLGEALQVSDGVTGSIFAAVGTALPETIIPILALIGFGSKSSSHALDGIGIGSILGAPLMLSTISLAIMSLFVIKSRGISGMIKPNFSGLQRDMKFFIFCYSLSFFIGLIDTRFDLPAWVRVCVAIILGGCYFIYVLLTVRESSLNNKDDRDSTSNPNSIQGQYFWLSKLGLPKNLFTITLQLVISVLLLIYFADLFINAVSHLTFKYGVSPMLLSLIIVPIATELPEKVNSIIWMRQQKDTLALGNITGAMVFQGSLLPILGIVFTPWKLDYIGLSSILFTLVASIWLYINAKLHRLKLWMLLLSSLFYILNLVICINLY